MKNITSLLGMMVILLIISGCTDKVEIDKNVADSISRQVENLEHKESVTIELDEEYTHLLVTHGYIGDEDLIQKGLPKKLSKKIERSLTPIDYYHLFIINNGEIQHMTVLDTTFMTAGSEILYLNSTEKLKVEKNIANVRPHILKKE